MTATECLTIDNTEESAEENAVENNEMKPITMRINDEEVEVTWEDNESVRALSDLVSGSPLTIESSMYGGFEQVGSIGTSLPSNDVNMRTEAGDIVLYSDSNMVVFYGSNSWSYTRLGHIENKSAEELADLLGGSDVTITLSAE